MQRAEMVFLVALMLGGCGSTEEASTPVAQEPAPAPVEQLPDLLGDWRVGNLVVQRVQAAPDGTLEVMRIRRHDATIIDLAGRAFERSMCRTCLLENTFSLDSPFGTLRPTGRLTWEFRYTYTEVTCGGSSGCQPQPQLQVRTVTMSEDGLAVTLTSASGDVQGRWTRVVPPTAAEQAALNAEAAQAQAEARAARDAQSGR